MWQSNILISNDFNTDGALKKGLERVEGLYFNQYFKPLKDARTHLQLTPLIFKVIITVIKAIYNNGRILILEKLKSINHSRLHTIPIEENMWQSNILISNDGAKKVVVDWQYDKLTVLDSKYMSQEAMNEMPEWQIAKMKYQTEVLPARIYLDSDDPDGMKNARQDKRVMQIFKLKRIEELAFLVKVIVVLYPIFDWIAIGSGGVKYGFP